MHDFVMRSRSTLSIFVEQDTRRDGLNDLDWRERQIQVPAEWGTTGAYERLDGTAYMEVDPRDPLNAGIVNLDKAPRNARGMVEFSAPFFILKPADMARGNQKAYYAVNNRGNKSGLPSLPPAPLLPSTNDP
jgi:hypothetical protein